jgi:ubiquinone/menaquinone biosynthesis C-methylase UbiE
MWNIGMAELLQSYLNNEKKIDRNMVKGKREKLRKTFREHLPKTGYSLPENPKILDLCCGDCPEAPVLREIFGGSVTGVDIDEKSIQQGQPEYNFILGDATKLSFDDSTYHIAAIRNPEMHGEGGKRFEPTKGIFEEAYRVLKEDGVIFGTCLGTEFGTIEGELEGAGFTDIQSYDNDKYSTPRYVNEKGHKFDEIFFVARKG